MTRLSLRTALCGLLLCAACGQRTCQVSGTVTWEGQPIDDGTINLIPTDPTVPAVSTRIVAGKYTITTLPGAKKVEIWASRAVGEFLPHMGMHAREMYIPEEYNARSVLEVEVRAARANHFSFDLPIQPREPTWPPTP